MSGSEFSGQCERLVTAAANDGRSRGVVFGKVACDGEVLSIERARGDEGSE